MFWRIGNSTLGMLAHLLDSTQSGFKVAHIIHSVEHPEDVNTIGRGTLNKLLYYVVGIVAVTKNILQSRPHWRTSGHHAERLS